MRCLALRLCLSCGVCLSLCICVSACELDFNDPYLLEFSLFSSQSVEACRNPPMSWRTRTPRPNARPWPPPPSCSPPRGRPFSAPPSGRSGAPSGAAACAADAGRGGAGDTRSCSLKSPVRGLFNCGVTFGRSPLGGKATPQVTSPPGGEEK